MTKFLLAIITRAIFIQHVLFNSGMFKKRCNICERKFKKSEGEKQKFNNFTDEVFVCRNCLDNYAIWQIGENNASHYVCPICGSNMQKVAFTKEEKSGFHCFRCQKTVAAKEITDKQRHTEKFKLDSNHPFDLSEITTTFISNYSAQIDLYYVEAQMVDTKLFVSMKNENKGQKRDKKKEPNEMDEPDFFPIETKDKKKPILKNRIRLTIELSQSKIPLTTWNKPDTSFDVHDEFGPGYSLTIAFSEPDNVLTKTIMPAVQECGFGSFPGKQWSHCHLSEQNPSEEKAKILIQKVTKSITNKLQKFVTSHRS